MRSVFVDKGGSAWLGVTCRHLRSHRPQSGPTLAPRFVPESPTVDEGTRREFPQRTGPQVCFTSLIRYPRRNLRQAANALAKTVLVCVTITTGGVRRHGAYKRRVLDKSNEKCRMQIQNQEHIQVFHPLTASTVRYFQATGVTILQTKFGSTFYGRSIGVVHNVGHSFYSKSVQTHCNSKSMDN